METGQGDLTLRQNSPSGSNKRKLKKIEVGQLERKHSAQRKTVTRENKTWLGQLKE